MLRVCVQGLSRIIETTREGGSNYVQGRELERDDRIYIYTEGESCVCSSEKRQSH